MLPPTLKCPQTASVPHHEVPGITPQGVTFGLASATGTRPA
jgi:hypothetical protein